MLAQTQLAEDRFQAMEARALLEIDRERTASAKLQKALDAERSAATTAAEHNSAQTSIGDLRQKIGTLEGALLAVTNARDHAQEQLQSTRIQLDQAIERATSGKSRVEQLREEMQSVLASQDERIAAAKRDGAASAVLGKKMRHLAVADKE